MINWYIGLQKELQVALISAVVALLTLTLKGVATFFYEKHSLSYKIKTEYEFKNISEIKAKLAETRTPLIHAAEELNYRLWNLKENISHRWLNLQENEWLEKKHHYLRSTVYRYLVFLANINEAENSIYHFDFSVATSDDNKYLKFVRTLKDFFCERRLLEQMDYGPTATGNHFYRNDCCKYAQFILKDNSIISFTEFEEKLNEGYDNIKDVFNYFAATKDDVLNKNYTIIKAFHLFLMLFLNKYGLDYHKTNRSKLKALKSYCGELPIKNSLVFFLDQHKVLSESWSIMDIYGAGFCYRIMNREEIYYKFDSNMPNKRIQR